MACRGQGWPVAGQLTMYTTTSCASCAQLKRALAADGIEFAEVDVENEPGAAQYVLSVNGGVRQAPTVVFSDGSALVNPSAAEVRQQLLRLAAT